VVLEQLDRPAIPGIRSPWYPAYLNQLMRTCMFHSHVTYDTPVCCVLALDSGVQGNVVERFQQLLAGTDLPAWLRGDMVDFQSLLRVYVLLHDASSEVPIHVSTGR
jgi:hypothetical protein